MARLKPQAAELKDTEDAAAFLGLSPRTLEKWRNAGGGPSYVKLGKRRFYPVDALRQFIARNVVAAA